MGPLPISAYTSPPVCGGSWIRRFEQRRIARIEVVNAQRFRSCTHPEKSAAVIRFGKVRTGCAGARILTGAVSSTTREFADDPTGNGGSFRVM